MALLAAAVPACTDDGQADGGGDATTEISTGGAPTDGDSTGAPSADTTASSGCGVTPDAWAAPEWSTNAANELALRAQLDTLTGDMTMRGAETSAIVIEDRDALMAIWNGDPSLAAIANPGYVPVIEGSFDEFLTVIAAGPAELVDDQGLWSPGPDGGVWGDDSRGINEGGLEVRQLVDKGGYSAGIFYAHAVSLTEGDITPATIDAIAAAWGANAELDPEGDLTDAAGYSYQMGFHADMAAALTAAKTYAGNDDCAADRDQALVTFFEQWERSMLARLVFYGNRAEGKLLTASTGTELASVLHDVAEGVGVGAGFIGLPDPARGPLSGRSRTIGDAEVTAIMTALGVNLDDLGASTTGVLLESLPNFEAALGEVETVVMDVYGFDADAIASFAMPTPG